MTQEQTAILCIRNIISVLKQQRVPFTEIHAELVRDCNAAYQLYRREVKLGNLKVAEFL